MRNFIIAAFIGIQLCASQFGYQNRELPTDTVATIGKQVITAKDFLERFELMPWPKKELHSRMELTKKEFLYSLVAEKLLAMEASNQNIGTDSTSISMQYNLERLFVRDELYKREVFPKISISQNEIQKGLTRFAFEIQVEILGVLSQDDGEQLYKKVVRSKEKNRTLHSLKDILYVPIDTLQVNFGQFDLALENAVYTMSKDSVSKPFQSPSYGWVVVHFLKGYTNEQYAKLSVPDQFQAVQKIIRSRKEDTLAAKAFASVTGSQKAEANPEIFMAVTDSIAHILRADSNAYKTKNGYNVSVSVFIELGRKLSDRLNDNFISIANTEPMTLGQVLIGLQDDPLMFPNLSTDAVQRVLNYHLKTVIQNELLSREGFKRNLNQTENVRHDIATWMDNRKESLLAHRIADTVSVADNDIDQEYRKAPLLYGATVMVKLREILVDSISLGTKLRARLTKGEDFSTLAKQFSKRKEWAKNGGESDFINVAQWGELGMFAASSKIGELEGPWKVKEGFTLFQVSERKIIDDSLRANFSETKRQIEQKVLQEKKQQVLNKYLGTLAKKYGVTLNEENLRRTQTTTTSMFTWRQIGFGGRIVAVPPVIRQAEWVGEWLKHENLNQ